MPFHEWLRYWLSGGAYYDPEGAATHEGNPPASRRTSSDDDDDEGDPDDEPPADAKEELARWRKYAKRLRNENKRRREETAELRSKLDASEAEKKKLADDHKKALDDAAKAAEDAKKAAVDEVRNENNARIINTEIRAQATKLGARDVDDLLKILDASDITIDDKTGNVVGADKAIEKLKEAKPHLFGEASQSTASKSEAPNPSKNEGKKATEMTDEEYQAAKATFIGSSALRRRA